MKRKREFGHRYKNAYRIIGESFSKFVLLDEQIYKQLRYFLELAYNGQNYFGWQRQPKQISVQEKIEFCLSTLLREEISIVGAGRTDTGVHAKKMYAHFDFDGNLANDFVQRLNSFLPEDISIYSIHRMNPEAHARFDAEKRTYQYHVYTQKNPFTTATSWQLRKPLDIEKMNEAANYLIKQADFGSFAKLHTDVKTNICTVHRADWTQIENDFLRFEITADRFLRNMVRAIVGTLVEVGLGKISPTDFNNIIEKKDRKFAGASAPPQGLFLVEVLYPENIFLS